MEGCVNLSDTCVQNLQEWKYDVRGLIVRLSLDFQCSMAKVLVHHLFIRDVIGLVLISSNC